MTPAGAGVAADLGESAVGVVGVVVFVDCNVDQAVHHFANARLPGGFAGQLAPKDHCLQPVGLGDGNGKVFGDQAPVGVAVFRVPGLVRAVDVVVEAVVGRGVA